MTNLETLELTISANAQSASQGVASLTSSLSALSKAVGKNVSGLRLLNAELGKLKGIGKVNLSTMGSAAKSVSKNINEAVNVPGTKLEALQMKMQGVTNAMEKAAEKGQMLSVANKRLQQFSIQKQIDKETKSLVQNAEATQTWAEAQAAAGYPLTASRTKSVQGGIKGYRSVMPVENPAKAVAEQAKADLYNWSKISTKMWNSETGAYASKYGQGQKWNLDKPQVSEGTKGQAKDFFQQAQAMETVEKTTKQASAAMKEYNNTVKQTATAATKHTHGLLSTIGRIAKTMLIRTAIRSLMKVAREGLNNFYEYSKAVSNGYAAAIDSMKMNATVGGNQIGAALGTLLATIAPIINAIISVVNAAATALTMLFALFGGSTTYTAAVAGGLNAVGGAAGGAGKQIKELLADFDELNIISQESGGGGGGGGGGNVGSMFQEMQLPQWMIEWKPLLEALAFGTIGALVLPKIFGWIKKILDLFTGGGATRLLDILKYWFRVKPDDGDDDPFPDMPDMPDYPQFPVQPNYKPFPPAVDYGKMATDMGILSGAAVVALPAVEGIVAALEKLKGGLNVMSVIGTVIALIAGHLLGGIKIGVEVDRKKFDEFVKEEKEWAKEKLTKILHADVDMTGVDSAFIEVNKWLKTKDTKTVYIDGDMTNLNGVKLAVDKWVNSKTTKTISTDIDYKTFMKDTLAIDKWAKEKLKKNILISMSMSDYTVKKNAINQWVAEKATKIIGVLFDVFSYAQYIVTVTAINAWVALVGKKKIETEVNDSKFQSLKKAISDFVGITAVKNMYISISNYTAFTTLASAIDTWANTRLTKIIDVEVNTPGGGGSSGGHGFSNGNPPATWDIWNGLTIDWGSIFGFASGGFPDRGQLFLARETGAELVGSIGGRTAVANNDQIVEGITEGVRDANAEQNALLRQQNELLRAILAKDNSISPSIGLGRTVRQSLDLYSRVGG